MTTANATNLMIVNNTGTDIELVMPYIMAFAKGEALHEDIADLFDLRVIYVDGQKRVLVDFAAD